MFDTSAFKKAMAKLARYENARTKVYVKISATKFDEKTGEIVEEWRTLRPYDVVTYVDQYGMIVEEMVFHSVQIMNIPERGSCDSRSHDVTMQFQGEDGQLNTIKVSSVKSTDNNCLIMAMSQCAKLGNGFRAATFRKQNGIAPGPIEVDKCDFIAQKMGITYALYKIQDNVLETI